MKLEKILKSQGLYYVALVLMIVNVLGYVSVGSIECIIVFAVSYYLSNSYTKNQSVDILVGLFAANVVFGCGRVREGMVDTSSLLGKGAAEAAKDAKDAMEIHTCDPTDQKCLESAAAATAAHKAAATAAHKAKEAKEAKAVAGK